jgi:hypothetical protein
MRYEAGLNLDKFRNSAHFYAITDWLKNNYPDYEVSHSCDDELVVIDENDIIGHIVVATDIIPECGAMKLKFVHIDGELVFEPVIVNPGRSQYD